MMYERICVSPRKGDVYRVEKEFIYRDVRVPEGYYTNGANVPRIFWSIFPPNRPDYLPAVIIHDYLCEKKEYKKADKYFEEIMRMLDVGWFTTFAMSKSVKLFHFITGKYKI